MKRRLTILAAVVAAEAACIAAAFAYVNRRILAAAQFGETHGPGEL